MSVLLLIIFIGGCGNMKEEQKKKQIQIKQIQRRANQKSFAKTLDMYPTENLEDFYNKEGYRDGEFKKMIKVLG